MTNNGPNKEKCKVITQYNKCYKLSLNKKYGNNIFTYPYYIDDNTIVGLFHFMNNFNTKSIIMEFTSITREPYFDKSMH